jgi:hypothetical protein
MAYFTLFYIIIFKLGLFYYLRLLRINLKKILIFDILFDLFYRTYFRNLQMANFQLIYLYFCLVFHLFIALLVIKTWKRFILLCWWNWDIEIKEVQGCLNVVKSTHKGWWFLWLDYYIIFILGLWLFFYVLILLNLDRAVFISLLGVFEHFEDIKLKRCLFFWVKFAPSLLCSGRNFDVFFIFLTIKEWLVVLAWWELICFVPKVGPRLMNLIIIAKHMCDIFLQLKGRWVV